MKIAFVIYMLVWMIFSNTLVRNKIKRCDYVVDEYAWMAVTDGVYWPIIFATMIGNDNIKSEKTKCEDLITTYRGNENG